MLFKRSTRSIVVGRRKDTTDMPEQDGSETHEAEASTHPAHRFFSALRLSPDIWICIGLMAVLILVVILSLVHHANSSAEFIPHGELMYLPCSKALAEEAEPGDVISLYSPSGEVIPELEYVKVYSSDAQEGLLLELEGGQISVFLCNTDCVPSLAKKAGSGAQALLEHQSQRLHPEIELTIQPLPELNPGKQHTPELTLTVLPEDGILPEIRWESSDPAIATVDADGILTAVSGGECTISASCGDVTVQRSLRVRVPLEALVIRQQEAVLLTGETLSLAADPQPANATDTVIRWKSGDPAIAIVDQNGTVTAVAPGTVTVTAFSGSISAECVIHVGRETELVQLTNHELTVAAGNSAQLQYFIFPTDNNYDTLSWISSDDAIATVDQKGTVTAVAPGTVTITLACGSLSDSCTVTVTAPPAYPMQ